MELNVYSLLIVVNLVLIISFLFNLFSKYIKIPTVLLLLGIGLLIRYGGMYAGYKPFAVDDYLELFGIIGLILIVLEGSLDLKINQKKIKLIGRSFFSALLILIVTAFSIAGLLYLWLPTPFSVAMIYAIPFSVISSAIAIPTVMNLCRNKKEFIVYESTFSDILGIMMFNYAITHHTFSWVAMGDFFLDAVIIIAFASVASVALLFFLKKVKSSVKFYIIVSILILIYAVGKTMHLSPLIIILMFGLLLNNFTVFTRWKPLKFLDIGEELVQFRMIVTESTFLIRTVFFVMFGYSLDLASLLNYEVIMMGIFIVIILLAIRYLYLRFFSSSNLFPELFIAPRGLITVLLFYSIPAEYIIPGFDKGVLFLVIIITTVLMLFGLKFNDCEVIENPLLRHNHDSEDTDEGIEYDEVGCSCENDNSSHDKEIETSSEEEE